MQRDGRDHARQLLHIAIAIAEREQMVDERAANRREQALHTAQPPLTPNRLAEMEFER
jgi:hypothetical protein